MALPVQVTINAVIRRSGAPVAGRLVFTRDTTLFPASSADDDYPIPEKIVAVVEEDGVLAQALAATNDPDFSPTGWTWHVQPHFPGWKEAFDISVPYDAEGGEVNLNELAPVPADGTGDLYSLVNHTHPGGGEGGPIAISDVTGLTAALAGKADDADITSLDGRLDVVEAALPGKADDADITALDGRLDTLEAVGALIFSSTGSGYTQDLDARIYVGPDDPGAVPNGSVWIETA